MIGSNALSFGRYINENIQKQISILITDHHEKAALRLYHLDPASFLFIYLVYLDQFQILLEVNVLLKQGSSSAFYRHYVRGQLLLRWDLRVATKG